MKANITTLAERIFIFNLTLTREQESTVTKALDLLESLYLTPFDLVLMDATTSQRLKYRLKLYEDPEIYLLSPGEVLGTTQQPLGYTQGILARTNLEFGTQEGFFLSDPLSEITETFKGYDSILFTALEKVSQHV